MANEKLTIKVDVDDDASAKFKKIGKAAEDAGQDVGQAFSKGAAQATRDIDALMGKIDKLGAGRAANLILSNNFKQIESDLVDLSIKLDALDADDPEVEVTLANIGQLEGDLDRITGKIKEINSTDAVVDVRVDASQATGQLDRMRDSADQSRSVLANMVGNTAQDLGELGGVAGSAGVFVGQLAEQSAEGSIALANLAKIAGPAGVLGALTVGISLFQKWKSAQEELAENTRQVTEAFQDGVGSAEDWREAVDEAFEAGTAGSDAFARQIESALRESLSEEQFNAFTQNLAALGLHFEDLGQLALTAGQDFQTYAETALAASEATASQASALGPLIDEWGGAADILNVLNENISNGIPLIDGYGNAVDQIKLQQFVEDNAALINQLDEIQEGFNATGIEDGAKAFLTLERAVSPAVDRLIEYAIAQNTANDRSVNWTAALDDYVTAQQAWNKAATEGKKTAEGWAAAQENSTSATEEGAEVVESAAESAERWARAQDLASAGTGAFAAAWEKVAAAANEYVTTGAGLEDVQTEINTLITYYGITQEDVLTKGIELWDEQTAAQEQAAETMMNVAEAAAAVNDALSETPDFAGALASEMDKVDSIFEGLVFDEAFEGEMDKALDGLEGFGPDLETLADRWAEILEGEPIDILGNVRANDAKALAAIEQVRNLFQQGVVNEYKQGGIAAAQAFVDAQVAEIQTRNPELSLVDIYRLMGLPDDGSIETLIQPTVDEAARAKAEAILDALAGVSGDPRIAQLQVALLTDNIDPEIAALAAQLLAYELGIGVKPTVDEHTTQAEIDEAQRIVDGSPLEVEVEGNTRPVEADVRRVTTTPWGTTVDVDADATEADTTIGGVTDPATDYIAGVYVIADTADARAALNTTAADRVAEFFALLNQNSRTFVDTALDNVARDRTADIFVVQHGRVVGVPGGSLGGGVGVGGRSIEPAPAALGVTPFAGETVGINPLVDTPSGSGLVYTSPTPVSMSGDVASPTIHNHVTISAAVIGSRFDVQRAVSKALRQSQRLAGSRV